ncbi:MAG: energy transducer TonB [Pseudomonadales bacterium]
MSIRVVSPSRRQRRSHGFAFSATFPFGSGRAALFSACLALSLHALAESAPIEADVTEESLVEQSPAEESPAEESLVEAAAGETALSEGVSAEPVPTSPANPFAEAANMPAPSLALPNRRDATGSSIEDILEELDPDLEQIQAQIEAGEMEIPKYWLASKIREIEQTSHRFDPALVRPLTLLGDIQAAEGEYTEALDSYGRAIHLERVNDGLVSAKQIEIVYREAEVYRTLGDLETANEREEYAYHVLMRSHDPYSEDMLPGLFHLARWYERTHNIFAARHLYERATDVLVANGKGMDLDAIPAWEGVARTYRLERFPPVYLDASDAAAMTPTAMAPTYGAVAINNFPAGERALQMIIQIHREHGSPTGETAQAILDLADWHLLFERTREAYPLYQVAYEMMETVDGFPVTDFFGEPKLIHFPAPSDPPPPSVPERTAEGLVSVRFDVTDHGSPRRLETIASEPEGMMDFRVRKSIRAARFRPALVDGVPTQIEGYTYTHRFTYYPQATLVETTEASPPAEESE